MDPRDNSYLLKYRPRERADEQARHQLQKLAAEGHSQPSILRRFVQWWRASHRITNGINQRAGAAKPESVSYRDEKTGEETQARLRSSLLERARENNPIELDT